MAGPPPNPNAVRRNARVGPTRLPAEGFDGPVPEWPLRDGGPLVARRDALLTAEAALRAQADQVADARTRRAAVRKADALALEALTLSQQIEQLRELEVALWADLWRTPQAAAWSRLRWTREVAQYVRWAARAELGDLDAGREARMWSDRLGLNPKAMRAMMWTIVADEVGEKRKTTSKRGARGRIKAVG